MHTSALGRAVYQAARDENQLRAAEGMSPALQRFESHRWSIAQASAVRAGTQTCFASGTSGSAPPAPSARWGGPELVFGKAARDLVFSGGKFLQGFMAKMQVRG